MQRESWRPVEGFAGYEVSELGRVRSWINTRGMACDEPHVLNNNIHDTGYAFVNLRREGRTHKRFVHTLVLEAFVCKRPAGMECRHVLTNDRADARLENLAWGDSAEQVADKRRHGTNVCGSKQYNAKLDERSVKEILAMYSAGAMQKDLAARYQVSRPTISNICQRKTWRHVAVP